MTPPLRRLLPVLVPLLLGAALPATAPAAGSVSTDGATLRVVEAVAGEVNATTVAVQEEGTVEVSDFGTVVPGPGCTASEREPAVALCPRPTGGIVVALGGGDDTFGTYLSPVIAPFPDGFLRVELGDGRDAFHGGDAAEVVDGGPGIDTLDGQGGADVLDGGPGDDALDGGEGGDVLRGGDGDDAIRADPYSDRGVFADFIDGGPGVDVLDDYKSAGGEGSAPPISVLLDGLANDGRAGENDDVRGIERIVSSSAGTFVGDDGPNAFVAPEVGLAGRYSGAGGDDRLLAGDASGDVLDGGAGDDDLSGGFGDDTLTGGPGRDVIAGDRPARCNEYHCDVGGGYGNDVIEARDGEVDSIGCGPGNDAVRADAADVVAADCERVERAAAPDQHVPDDHQPTRKPVAALSGSTRLRAVLKAGATVKVTGAKAGSRVSVSFVLSAATARKHGLTRGRKAIAVATGSAKATKAGTATVRVRFTRSARTRLARAKAVAVSVKATGARTRTVTFRR